MNRSMTKHQATAVIILREQVTGEWRPDPRGQSVEAKARPCQGQGYGHDFLSSRCPRGRGQSSRTPSLITCWDVVGLWFDMKCCCIPCCWFAVDVGFLLYLMFCLFCCNACGYRSVLCNQSRTTSQSKWRLGVVNAQMPGSIGIIAVCCNR